MKTLALIALLFAAPLYAEPVTVMEINTGAQYPAGAGIPCDGQYFWHRPAVLFWQNPRGVPMRIYSINAGMFQDFQISASDFFVEVRLGSTNERVTPYWHWDHYQQPTAPVIVTKDFRPNYLELGAHDGLMLVLGCNPIKQTKPGGANVIVQIEVNK